MTLALLFAIDWLTKHPRGRGKKEQNNCGRTRKWSAKSTSPLFDIENGYRHCKRLGERAQETWHWVLTSKEDQKQHWRLRFYPTWRKLVRFITQSHQPRKIIPHFTFYITFFNVLHHAASQLNTNCLAQNRFVCTRYAKKVWIKTNVL